MPSRQGNLFKDSPEARQCASCEQMFVPDEDYHEFCPECFERRQKRRKRDGKSNVAWVERFYGQGA